MIDTAREVPTTQDALGAAKDLARHLKARAADADERGEFLPADVEALKTSGLLGLSVPREVGGWGASLETTLAALLELSQGSTSAALVAAMTLHIVGRERELKSWSPGARETVFRAVAAGALVNSAASEPRLGSPSRGGLPDSYAERSADGYVLNGHKNWVTGGEHLAYLLVRVRLSSEAAVFWLSADTPGLRWERTWGNGLSLRASDSHDLYFENVELSEGQLLPSAPPLPLVWFPLSMAAVYLGTGLAARNDAIRYALERTPTALGKPIATLPGIQRQIGDIDVALKAARTLLLNVAAGWTGTENEAERAAFTAEVAAAKHLAVETALQVTDKALRLVGAAGIDKGLALERYFRDARAGLLHPPSGDTALESVGRSALGL